MIAKEVFVRQTEKLLNVCKKLDPLYEVLSEDVNLAITTPIDIAEDVLTECMGRPTMRKWADGFQEDWISFYFYDVWAMGNAYPREETANVNGKAYSISNAAELYDMIVAEYGNGENHDSNA